MQFVIPGGTRIHIIDHPDITGTVKSLRQQGIYTTELDDIGEIDLPESNLVRIEPPIAIGPPKVAGHRDSRG